MTTPSPLLLPESPTVAAAAAPAAAAPKPAGSLPIPVPAAPALSPDSPHITQPLQAIAIPPTIITTAVSPTSPSPGALQRSSSDTGGHGSGSSGATLAALQPGGSPLSVASDRSVATAPGQLPPSASATNVAAIRAAARGPRGPQDFKYGQILGEGSYSTVVEAWDLLSDPKTPQAQAAGLSSPVRSSHLYAQSPESAASAIVRENSTADTAGKRVYAIKILHKAHIVKEKKHKYVVIEKEALSRLTRAPGIITLYWTFQDRESLYFVLALAPNGELLSHIKTLGSFSLASTRFYSAQLSDAIRSIHEAGVIHRDVKPENILFDKEMRIKVTDFGSAKILSPASASASSAAVLTASSPSRPALTRTDDDNRRRSQDGRALGPRPSSASSTGAQEKASSFVGTAEYVSPELLLSRSVSFASDWWAFGCIVFQMLCGRPPFKGPTEYQTFQRILHRELEWPEQLLGSEDEAQSQERTNARSLVDQLLVLAPEDRLGYADLGETSASISEAAALGARTIQSQPFFKETAWTSLWTSPVPALEAGLIPPRIPISTPMSQLEYEFGDAAFFEEGEDEEDGDELDADGRAAEDGGTRRKGDDDGQGLR